MSDSDVLLRHLIARVQSDVNILVELGHLDLQQATSFLANLPGSQSTLTAPSRRLVTAPPAPAPKPIRVKALWAYNEQGTDPDLSFSAGDMIEIIEKTNDDWWTGKVNGRQGLFPSNHVEAIQDTATVSMPEPSASSRYMPPALTGGKKPYKPFGAALHGNDQPLATSTNSIGLQQAPGQEEKKSKTSGLKNTMANSAAGGVGFGAGAAIGGGLIRAIF